MKTEAIKTNLVGIEKYAVNEGTDLEYFEKFAHSVYSSHPLAEVVYTDDMSDYSLKMAGKVVKGYEGTMYDFKIPVHYCLRAFCNERKYNTFVCGLDLTDCGKVWISLKRDILFDTIEDAVKFAESIEGKYCQIFTEEKLKVN